MVCGLVFQANIYVLYALTNVSELLKAILFTVRARSNKWLRFIAKQN